MTRFLAGVAVGLGIACFFVGRELARMDAEVIARENERPNPGVEE